MHHLKQCCRRSCRGFVAISTRSSFLPAPKYHGSEMSRWNTNRATCKFEKIALLRHLPGLFHVCYWRVLATASAHVNWSVKATLKPRFIWYVSKNQHFRECVDSIEASFSRPTTAASGYVEIDTSLWRETFGSTEIAGSSPLNVYSGVQESWRRCFFKSWATPVL